MEIGSFEGVSTGNARSPILPTQPHQQLARRRAGLVRVAPAAVHGEVVGSRLRVQPRNRSGHGTLTVALPPVGQLMVHAQSANEAGPCAWWTRLAAEAPWVEALKEAQ